jgi:nickel/cobalt transporter (NiCoT) family protein
MAKFRLSSLLDDAPDDLRGKIIFLYCLLLAFNLVAWILAFKAFRNSPMLLGTAALAYSFGLRHAVDADHLAAIDNVTRKLMQDGKRPVAVGLMFSLGHSTIVLVGSACIAQTALLTKDWFSAIRSLGSLAGTLISAFFLFAIAIVNSIVLRTVYQEFRRVRRGEQSETQDFDFILSSGGLLARAIRPLFAMVHRSWQMYPLGILFGLGFDTATEVGVLTISAVEGSKGMSLWTVLLFPALFAAGMALVDATDNTLMLGAYGWAFVKPIRKLYYNLTITSASVVVALIIGGIEILGLAGEHFHLQSKFWKFVLEINGNFAELGYLVVAVFVLSWIISIVVYKWRRFDSLGLEA